MLYDAHGRPIYCGRTHECSCTQPTRPQPRTSVAVPAAKTLASGLVAAAAVLAVGQVISTAITVLASTSFISLLIHALLTSRRKD